MASGVMIRCRSSLFVKNIVYTWYFEVHHFTGTCAGNYSFPVHDAGNYSFPFVVQGTVPFSCVIVMSFSIKLCLVLGKSTASTAVGGVCSLWNEWALRKTFIMWFAMKSWVRATVLMLLTTWNAKGTSNTFFTLFASHPPSNWYHFVDNFD